MKVYVLRHLVDLFLPLGISLLTLSLGNEFTLRLSREAAKNHLVAFFTGFEALQSENSSKEEVFTKLYDLCEAELHFYDVDLNTQLYDNILFDEYLYELMHGKRLNVGYPNFRSSLDAISLQSPEECIALFSRTDTRGQSQKEQFYLRGSDQDVLIQDIINVGASAQRDKAQYEQLMAQADAAFSRKEFRVARSLYLKASKYSSVTAIVEDAQLKAQECFAAIQEENEILLSTQLQDIARAKQRYASRDYEESYELFKKHERNLDQEATYLFGRLLYYNYGNIIRKKRLNRKGTIALGRFYIALAAKRDFQRGNAGSRAINLYYQMLRE